MKFKDLTKSIADSIIIEINKHSPVPVLHPFKMTRREKKLFDQTLSTSSLYLEFGAGGSTFYVLRKTDAKVVSVDTSESWLEMMKKYLFIQKMEENGRLLLSHVDIGPTGNWGRPVGESGKNLYPKFSRDIFNEINVEELDTVLVDGRFRVACALMTLLQCKEKDSVNILFHDFHRKHYHPILNYCDKVDEVDDLVLLQPKDNIDYNKVQAAYDQYKYDDD